MSEENDPLVEAKKWLEQCRTTTDMATKRQIALVDHLSSEIDRLTKRLAELEEEPEFTPAVLKRADEIVLGDVVLSVGAIRTVTEIDLEPNQRIIRCDDWRGWHKNDDLIAVLPGSKNERGAGNEGRSL